MKSYIVVTALLGLFGSSAFADSNISCTKTEGNEVYTVKVTEGVATIQVYDKIDAESSRELAKYDGVKETVGSENVVRQNEIRTFVLDGTSLTATTLDGPLSLKQMKCFVL